jgi:hypothetical protein
LSLLNKIRPAGSKKQRVKALLTGSEETGKSTSVLNGAERPLLVFDLEDGNEIYSHSVEAFDVYPSNDPEEILEVVNEMIAFKSQGGQIPYNSIFIDSGTDLYKKIISNEIKKLQMIQGNPNKRGLEPKEYGYPNSIFYDIIKGIKSLDVDFYISAHASRNYLEGAFMKVDPNNPVKADVHKDLAHEMDVHIILKKIGAKGRNIKAEIKKSRLDDKDGNPLLPAVMEKVDNKTFIKTIRELAQRDKGFEVEKPQVSNVIQTDGELSNMIEEIIDIAMNQLKMSNERAVQVLQEQTEGKVSAPQQLDKGQASAVLNALRGMREQAGEGDQAGE